MAKAATKRERVYFPYLETEPSPPRGEPWELARRDLPHRLARLRSALGWPLEENGAARQ